MPYWWSKGGHLMISMMVMILDWMHILRRYGRMLGYTIYIFNNQVNIYDFSISYSFPEHAYPST